MSSRRQPTEERRRQIALAALEILGEKGVHRLTAMELARKVGIADGTIFRHFPGKKEIVQAAIAHLSDLLFEGFPPQERAPLERLERFFLQRVRLVRRFPAVLRVAMSDRLAEAAGEEGVQMVRALQERSTSFVLRCLKEAQTDGAIDAALDPQVLSWAVIGVLRGAALGDFPFSDGPGRHPLAPEKAWATVAAMLRGKGKAR
jgi:AcrR family transcriptional regulator